MRLAFLITLLSVSGFCLLFSHEIPASLAQQKVNESFTSLQIAQAEKELIDVTSLNAGFILDIRYATTNNFTGVVLYPVAKAYLNQDAATALVAVQSDLKKKRLGLKIFDAYRPLPIQQKMWDLIQDDRYVSNPATNAGRHTRGTAVDVSLIDLKTGKELRMPSPFDDFSEKAHVDSKNATQEEQKNSQLLRETMVRHGFIVFPYEWWHFDYQGWEKYPPMSIGLDELKKK